MDRDGVINDGRPYVHRVEDFVFVNGAINALRALQASDYLLVVQSGIARGLYTEADYLRLTEHMRDQLRAAGIWLAAVEHCPHLPNAPVTRYRLECECRKPRPGMLLRAIAGLGIDVGASVLIGDRASDIEAGRAAGIARCFLVRTGNSLPKGDEQLADAIFDDLTACVDYLGA